MAKNEGVFVGMASCTKETPKAILVVFEDSQEEKWIPKSQIHDDSEVYEEGDSGVGRLVITKWFAEREGLG